MTTTGLDIAKARSFAAMSYWRRSREVNHMQENLFGALVAIVLSVGCGGSNKQAEAPQQEPSPGDKIEQAGENAEEAAEKAAEDTGEAAEKAGDKAENKTRDED